MTKRTRTAAAARGALLLEVVVALVIMTAAMGILGAQLVAGMKLVTDADQRARTAELADRAMALLELDLQYAEQLANDQKLDGDFGDQYPGYFWHVHIDPLDVPGLGLITLQVLQQRDPDKIESSDGATIVRELHYLKAAPQKIDLASDFGFNEDQITTITQNVPLPAIAGGELDVPALIKQLTEDPTTMMQMLPALMQAFSGMINGAGGSNVSGGDSIDAMRELMAENMRAALSGGDGAPAGRDLAGGDLTGDGVRDASDLLQLRDQMFGQQPGGGRGGPRGLNRGRGGMPRLDGDGGGVPGRGGDGSGTRGGRGADGGAPPSGGRDPAQALEELMRLRDEFNRRQRDGG